MAKGLKIIGSRERVTTPSQKILKMSMALGADENFIHKTGEN
jgi:hypothetical protein